MLKAWACCLHRRFVSTHVQLGLVAPLLSLVVKQSVEVVAASVSSVGWETWLTLIDWHSLGMVAKTTPNFKQVSNKKLTCTWETDSFSQTWKSIWNTFLHEFFFPHHLFVPKSLVGCYILPDCVVYLSGSTVVSPLAATCKTTAFIGQ